MSAKCEGLSGPLRLQQGPLKRPLNYRGCARDPNCGGRPPCAIRATDPPAAARKLPPPPTARWRLHLPGPSPQSGVLRRRHRGRWETRGLARADAEHGGGADRRGVHGHRRTRSIVEEQIEEASMATAAATPFQLQFDKPIPFQGNGWFTDGQARPLPHLKFYDLHRIREGVRKEGAQKSGQKYLSESDLQNADGHPEIDLAFVLLLPRRSLI
ncbi:uncharacterized protein [Zea mays]|nr:uncharacterized protein LOC103637954 isoform X2 [Zea mays]